MFASVQNNMQYIGSWQNYPILSTFQETTFSVWAPLVQVQRPETSCTNVHHGWAMMNCLAMSITEEDHATRQYIFKLLLA